MSAPDCAEPDPGSFRDPSNRVILYEGHVFRGLSAAARDDFDALASTEFYQQGQDSGSIVRTALVDEIPQALAHLEWTSFLEHDRVPVISYAYEWSFGMLRDAALLQLDLTLGALSEGLITKDATPYNVQFVDGAPVHIDIGSFECMSPDEPWFGYRQFCEHFLFPLVLSDRRGIAHQSALRGSTRGITPADCAASLRMRDLWRPSLFLHVGMHARADRKATAEDASKHRSELKSAGFGPRVIKAQVERLRSVVDQLQWRSASSTWSDYSSRSHYEDASLRTKAQFVENVAKLEHRRLILDLGANDGFFSDLVAPYADQVVAVDHDPVVVDRLYGEIRGRSKDSRILPLVMDLADPSGPIGWRSRERPSFADRVRPELVLCLALIHHLAITDSIPLEEVLDFLADFEADLVLEFPLPEDQMVEMLMAQKKDRVLASNRYSLDRFETSLITRFETLRRETIGSRVLYHLRPLRSSNDRSYTSQKPAA